MGNSSRSQVKHLGGNYTLRKGNQNLSKTGVIFLIDSLC